MAYDCAAPLGWKLHTIASGGEALECKFLLCKCWNAFVSYAYAIALTPLYRLRPVHYGPWDLFGGP